MQMRNHSREKERVKNHIHKVVVDSCKISVAWLNEWMSKLIVQRTMMYVYMITIEKWHWTLSTQIKLLEKIEASKIKNDNDDYDDTTMKKDPTEGPLKCIVFAFSSSSSAMCVCVFCNVAGVLMRRLLFGQTTSTVEQHLVLLCYYCCFCRLLLYKIMWIWINLPWSTTAPTLLMHLTNIIIEIMHKCDLITFKRR